MYLKDPSNKKGLCGTTANRPRRSLTGVLIMLSPSTKICPPQIGVRRKRAFNMLDFPAPVLPTIPTWKHMNLQWQYANWREHNFQTHYCFKMQILRQSISGIICTLTCVPPSIVKLMSCKAAGKEGLYLIVTFWNSINPWNGQSGLKDWYPQSSSWGTSIY